MSTRRRTALAGALLVPALAACGTNPETSAVTRNYAPADGVQAILGDLRVLNALVVEPAEEGGTAILSMTITAGDQGDTLQDVTVSDATARIEGETEVAAGSSVRYGAPSSTDQILLEDFQGPVGGNVELTLLFEEAGSVVLNPPVVAPTGYYEGLTADQLVSPTPGPLPTPTLAPTPGATQEEPAVGREEGEEVSEPTAEPSGEQTPESSAEPTPDATP
ncbi:hypothetical protein [Vallicoccus soli]|uniref:Copper chaperone PCu(A)C n=1 Tax=Vallicoccus soli TaxID=2339232 RepID=A0A3A3Z0G2_9ACTN|nr:hypothetical protein [Vallicoccus soli]RJK97739.1 hypothetical protein D5H78_01700 [Vallicoccus soli]